MLACNCEYDGDGWWYEPPDDFKKLDTNRRKRCCSCNKLIGIGADCVEFHCFRDAYSDIEERIRGEHVQLANWYLCDWCGQMYYNLEFLGYCYYLGDSLQENLEDYWDLTGFEPK